MITRKLFSVYKTPADYASLTIDELEKYISSCNFYHNKAKNIIGMSRVLLDKFHGEVPSNHSDLLSLPGVGNKTANVVLAVGFGVPAFAVDTHVFRVCNRLGLTKAKNVLECEKKITAIYPKEVWGKLHHLILLFGRYYCKAIKPQCKDCVLSSYCKYIKNTKEK
jgi:endonuclease-3